MVLQENLFLYVFFGIFIFHVIVVLLAYGMEKWSSAIVRGIIVGALITSLLQLPTKDIYVVNDRHVVGSYTVLGSPTITTADGTIFVLDDYQTNIGGIYLFNLSQSRVVVYPVKYSISGIFNREGREVPAPLLIEANDYSKLKHEPSYWFMDAPESISSSDHFLSVLWKKIFGSFTVKWVVDDYDTMIN